MSYSKSEKKSILKFLLLYYGSSFALTLIVALLAYRVSYTSIVQTQEEKMRAYALNLSSEIINAHMHHLEFRFEKHQLYDTRFLNEKQKLDFDKQEKSSKDLWIVDASPHHHLGIDYIVVTLKNSDKLFESLQEHSIIGTILVLFIFSFVGFFLTKMFIQPIKNERIRLDNFIKDTTHELNTPIHSLILSLEAFEKNPIKNMLRIKASAFRISDIYANLTYIFRLGDENETILSIDFKKLIDKELLIQEEYIKAKKLQVTCDIDEFYLEMDFESASRLVSNLLSNAIKYNKPNGKINIYTKDKKLIFEDSGIGIKSKDVDKLTTRYFRATSYSAGFGIGLDIVYKITQRYNLKLTIIPKNEGVIVEVGSQ